MTTINKLVFQQLKGLRDLTIELPPKGLIALMGENGIGKSTVLHALACLYKPHEHAQVNRGDQGNWWTDWFIPHTGNLWAGSQLRAYFSDKPEGAVYRKADRWVPRKQDRRERYNRFIGLRDCMPHIEEERQTSRFEFALTDLDMSAAKQAELVQVASFILNKRYIAVQKATKTAGLRSFLFATVSRGQPPQQASYTSHYMGAGEYKVLKLLQEVLKAQNGSLIVIEELEVSIHDAALRHLVRWLVQQAEVKNLQIVISTHWPPIVEFAKDIHIRTLLTTGNEIVCINGYKPMALHRMTGNEAALRLITVWVEDSFAAKVVQQVAAELGISPNLVVKVFGSVENSFSIAAVLEIDQCDVNKNLIVIDGDKYTTPDERLVQMKTSLTGTGEKIKMAQINSLRWFSQFNPAALGGALVNPERVVLIAAGQAAATGNASPWVVEYVEYANQNVFQDENKTIVFNLHTHFKRSLDQIGMHLIEAASKDASWTGFTQNVRDRLSGAALALDIDVKGVA